MRLSEEILSADDSGILPLANWSTRIAAIENILLLLTERYTSLVNSGDCGNWNPEEETIVIKAREALK